MERVELLFCDYFGEGRFTDAGPKASDDGPNANEAGNRIILLVVCDRPVVCGGQVRFTDRMSFCEVVRDWKGS